jgi:hypothetical protein
VRTVRLNALGRGFEDTDELTCRRDFDKLLAEDERELDRVIRAVRGGPTVERKMETDYFAFAHAWPM